MPYKIRHNRFTITALLGAVVILGVCGFVLGNMRDLLFGAPFAIETVQDGTTLTEGFLPISGKARHARSVTMNGRTIFIDRDGNFTDGVILSPGYNVVEVILRDQFGKEKVTTYHLVLDEATAVAQVRPPEMNYQQ